MLVGTEEEICIAGGHTDVLEALASIRRKSDAVIVLKRGPLGCSIFTDEIPASPDDGIAVRGTQVEVLNVLGAGDAFLSGFLHAWLNGESWEDCARSGNACGALVVSRHGCTPAMPTRRELENYLQRCESILCPDQDPHIRYLHEATTRRKAPTQMFVLAFDHRRQLEDLVASGDDRVASIAAFKNLVCEAVLRVAGDIPEDTGLGIIVDDRYGESVLARMTADKWWIGRPVEVPGSRPVEFDPQNNMGIPLTQWPATHTVKCLVFYHPDDDIKLRLEQERRVCELFADCSALGRELLLEVIATSRGAPVDDSTVANIMRRFYNLGVYPAWWKLESQTQAGWQEISNVINELDELCNGVLLLGLDAPEADLRKSFRIAAPNSVCRGFAVGRSIFGDAARHWFDGSIGDDEVIERVATNYLAMIRFWEEAASARAGCQATG